MAVAHDLATESHTGTTGSASQDNFNWSHGGASSVAGVIVFVMTVANAADIIAVRYGNLNLAPVPGGQAIDTTTEPGRCNAYFGGRGVPGGTQTVNVDRVNNADVMYAVACTVTAGANLDTAVHEAGIVLLENDGTLAEQSVTDGSPGTNSLRYAGCFTGLQTLPTAGASSTLLQSIDLGATGGVVVRETTAGQGARNVGFSSGTSDDRACVHLAIKEVAQPNPIPERTTAPMMAAA